MNGAIGSWKRTVSIAGLSRSAARATSGLWNAPETFSLMALRAPRLSASAQQLLDCVVLARDHDLAGAVVVRRPHADDLAAEVLDRLVLEPEDGGHRAGVLAGRLGHRETALAHEADRLGRAHRADRGERRELADRMADDDVRLDALGSRIAARMARHVATSAGCCTSVSTRSSSGESKQSVCRSRPDASLPTR